MPTPAEIIADPATRSLCELWPLPSVPDGVFDLAALDEESAGLPRLPFDFHAIRQEEAYDVVCVRGPTSYGPLPDGASVEATALALVLPGAEPVLVEIVDLGHRYRLHAGDTLHFNLTLEIPR